MKTGLRALLASLLALTGHLNVNAVSLPSSFPASGKALWFTTPGTAWSKDYLPVGNGYLAAMVPGGTTYEDLTVNIESLWSGGPFQSPDYNGGNPTISESSTIHTSMQNIRSSIFSSPTGTISNDEFDVITSPVIDYGSYASPGRFAVSMTGNATTGTLSNFVRWLDLDEGVARSQWNVGKVQLTRETFCSHPAGACTQLTSSNAQSSLFLTYAFVGQTDGSPVPSITCFDNATLLIRGNPSAPGMEYEILARVQTNPPNLATCASSAPIGGGSANATISVAHATSSWMNWVGGTNFDQDAGNAAHNFTFAGADPHAALLSSLNSLSKSSPSTILNDHLNDITTTLSTKSAFQLDLGQKIDLSKPTDELVAEYQIDTGNPYLEWLTFHLGRYMLWASARGKLPANLQGKWARDSSNPWSADSNINIQMNYWAAETTGLDVTSSLFDYFEKNWAPRGSETAQLLYNISRGWVVHNETFGYSGMKGVGGTAQWANYPEANVWMMLHVWDHFDYTGDVTWFKAQGWPLLKGVASFHLDKLINDLHFNDGTLVVAPCNSPEQSPITFGCAHAQQLIWMLFNAIEKGFSASGDTDTAFLKEVQAKKAQMDKGLHIGSWGQLQEWKFDMDSPTDTHRYHLSHLIGLYPGYAVSNFAGQTNNTKQAIINAAEISLIHRGNGTGPDADAGWEKAWRAACWAQLGNASEFYHELTYTLQRNFGPNLFSLYDPGDSDPIFQIDANLGYPGAVINALLQAPDVPSISTPLTITLLPALPTTWNTGSFQGLRVRGGLSVSLAWRDGKPTSGVITQDRSAPSRPVVVMWQGKQIAKFMTGVGKTTTLQF
ncbi:glycoside hydrolase family 95 protein [Sphaerobolus stellatus SS14]|nr:glycoside hydrolase family 95 protein [Sphaerobolus stellatus SS14]